MSAQVFSLCEYRKRKPVEEKSSDADSSAEVISLCDARRLKSARKSGETFKGTNFPLDYLVGPDEPGEDFGSLLMNLSLDNPNFPYMEERNTAIEESKKWLDEILKDD